MLGTLVREPCPLIAEEDRIYFRDCYDHAVQVIDLVENYRELGTGLTEVYLSSISNRLNEVIKVLTIFTTLFIPLNLIAGIYGMNFHVMPELSWPLGYPFALGLMAVAMIGAAAFFRRNDWF